MTRILTKREIRNELFTLLAMCNGFCEVGHTGGKRQDEMVRHLPHQMALRIMELQDLIESSGTIEEVSAYATEKTP